MDPSAGLRGELEDPAELQAAQPRHGDSFASLDVWDDALPAIEAKVQEQRGERDLPRRAAVVNDRAQQLDSEPEAVARDGRYDGWQVEVSAETDPARAFVVSGFRSVEGNSARNRSGGVARVAVERDIYAAGRARLLVNLSPVDSERTLVRLAAEVQATVERRGEIQYAGAPGARSPLPLLTAWTTAKPEEKGSEWENLTSNGVVSR